ncbi:MAG: hypothetical protein KDB90_14580, partial [Planctomycetes bacterium]|nr:hypothetical protein [Planctomycetota bacterium]
SLTVTKGTLEYLPTFTVESADGSYRADSTSYNTRPQEVVIDLLPPGTYTLKSDGGEMEVVVSADTSVVYAPRNYDCYVLSIKPAGGRIETLGLLDGDKLIEIDGTSMAEENLSRLALETSLTKDNTTWTVQRNGAIIPVTFSGKDLMTILEDRSKETREKLRPKRAYRD